CFIFLFFFSSRRRHTRWPRDWSSDVCSSDLHLRNADRAEHPREEERLVVSRHGTARAPSGIASAVHEVEAQHAEPREVDRLALKIGRASCRERGWVSAGERVCERKGRERESV